MTPLARFVAPQPLPVEGGLGMPGRARWITAFTTAAPGWLAEQWGASHLHRAQFWTEIDEKGTGGAIQWRLESQPTGIASSGPTRIVEGEAQTLDLALGTAFGAACRDAALMAPHQPFTPAFIAMPGPAGAPRIWGTAALFMGREAEAARRGPFGQTCFIREFLAPEGSVFSCVLESGDPDMPHRRRWDAPDLTTAVTECEDAMQREDGAAVPAAARRSAPGH
jgi:hypothetical protein